MKSPLIKVSFPTLTSEMTKEELSMKWLSKTHTKSLKKPKSTVVFPSSSQVSKEPTKENSKKLTKSYRILEVSSALSLWHFSSSMHTTVTPFK